MKNIDQKITQKNIRIVFIITGLGVGGAEIMLYKILSRIDREKFTPKVISLIEAGPIKQRIQELQIPVEQIGINKRVPDPRGFFRLIKKVKEFQPDIIQTWMYHSDLFGGIVGRFFIKKPVVWNVRNSNLSFKSSKMFTILCAKICAFLSSKVPDRIVCCGESSRDVHINLGYNKNKFVVIGNGFNLKNFHPIKEARSSVCEELGIGEGSFIVGLVGRYDEQKDHSNFIKSAAILKKSIPEAVFLLCGDGVIPENKKLFNQISRLSLVDSFYLLGRRTDMSRLNNSFDVACSSSSYGEAFSNTIGEAMACAVPVVATDVGDAKNIIQDCGFVVSPSSPLELANAVITIYEMGRDGRLSLGLKGRHRVIKCYSIENIASKYESLYFDILNYNN